MIEKPFEYFSGSPVEVALKTAAIGLKIFPWNPETHKPYAGFKDWGNIASCDPQQIKAWWTAYPDAMTAIPTGKTNGIFVFDVDVSKGKVGLQSLKELENEYGELDPYMIVSTPSGGMHYYFAMPEDVEIKNKTDYPKLHCDIRGTGGCVIGAGSVRHDGSYKLKKFGELYE